MQKTIIISSLMFLSGLALIFLGITRISKGKNISQSEAKERGLKQFVPVKVKYFNVGDTLLPDYAINDTLIVGDAAELNYHIAFYEQQKDFGTDADIANLFYKYCLTPYKYAIACSHSGDDMAILNDEIKEALNNPDYK